MTLARSAFSPKTKTVLGVSWKVALSAAVFSLIMLTSSFVAFDIDPVLAACAALIALVVVSLVVCAYANMRQNSSGAGNSTLELGILMPLCGVLGLILAIALTFPLSDRVDLSSSVAHAKAKVGNQAVYLDITPAVLADLEEASQSYESAQNYRELIKDIHAANYSRKDVLSYIIAARTLGVDASFVRENGFVRQADEKALFDVALNRAKNGDLTAQGWLMEQEARASR